MERDAPVAPETLLALLLRPLTLETGSVKGIVPPFGACNERWTRPRRAIQMSRRCRERARNVGGVPAVVVVEDEDEEDEDKGGAGEEAWARLP